MDTNEYYEPNKESERDFFLRAMGAGARIGYYANGTTCAIVDTEVAPVQEITFLPTFAIYAFDGEKGPNGDFVEWHMVNPIISEGMAGSEDDRYFILEGFSDYHALLYRPGKGWAVDADGDTCELTWSPTPTEPADRIEEYARDLAAQSVPA